MVLLVKDRIKLLLLAGTLVGVALGSILLIAGATGPGLLFLIGTPIAAGINYTQIKRSSGGQRPGAPRRPAQMTGHVLTPRMSRVYDPGTEARWTGGGNVATELGRINATLPLAVLAISRSELVLRFRPKLITRMFGVTEVRWPVSELLTVYPVRGRYLRFNKGLAIESTAAPLAYFWTRQPSSVLSSIAERDAPVDWAERYIKLRT
jgi:hypothetical protein